MEFRPRKNVKRRGQPQVMKTIEHESRNVPATRGKGGTSGTHNSGKKSRRKRRDGSRELISRGGPPRGEGGCRTTHREAGPR